MDDTPMTAAFDAYVAAITGLTDSGSTVSEDDLKPPVKSLVEALAADSHPTAGMRVHLEVSVKSGNTVVGRPDLTVLDKGGRVVGYVELKHLSKSADPTVLTGHDKMQWETGFAALPNIVYTNGTHATLWHYGTQVGEAALADAAETQHVWQEFLDYAPQPIKDPRRLAVAFGRRARRLREAVEAALSRQQGQSIQLRDVWRASLDADMTDSEFADNFAQVAVSALLLAKGEMQQTPSDLLSAVTALRQSGFSLVSEVLQHVDTVSSQDDEIAIALAAVVDTVASTDSANLSDDGWWLTFYEAFISEYDAGLQKERGVFYTPSEIVDFQLEACDWVLRHTLNLSDGYASRNVTVLDPACGTGTYLTRLVDKLVEDTTANLGEGAVPETVASLLERIYGFEIMPAPYTISQTRLAAKSKAHQTPARETVLLTDTLSSTGLSITNSLFANELTKQQQRANDIKDPKTRVTVVVGNPPYARVPVKHQSRGGIVTGGPNLFKDFKNKTPHPMSKQLRVAYEMALYFWRWSIWKVCEQTHPNRSEAGDAGIVSFISPASWLTADGCAGVRAHMRDKFDDIWIVDLGGDQRAVRKDGDNVFPIQTPVCIAVAVRDAQTTEHPARVHYRRVVAGTRHDKLNALKDIKLADIAAWDRCPTGSTDPFTPAGAAGWYASQPLLTNVLEWRSPGVKYNRTWPIALTPQTATNRWDTLMAASATQRSELFKENMNRNLNSKKKRLPHTNPPHPSAPIADLPAGTPSPHPQPYSYRPFDTRVALADNRLCNDPRPPLWEAHSPKQAYLVTPKDTDPGSEGPCAVVYTELPDNDSHHGRGGGGGNPSLARPQRHRT